MHRPDHREGSFLAACDEMMSIHDRVADNGLLFAHALLQMHTDLIDASEAAERHRKGFKSSGMTAEQRVAEVEQAMKKSKAKYDALAEEYDRARTGDMRPGGKMSLFKMQKSPAQQEEDLLRKVQGAEQAYFAQVQTLQSERAQLLATTRPETVKSLQSLILETDAILALQLQKFGKKPVLLERVHIPTLVPRATADSSPQPPSMRGYCAAMVSLSVPSRSMMSRGCLNRAVFVR